MRARVAFGFLLLVLVSCGDDGGDPSGGSTAGAPSTSGSGGNASGAGPSGGNGAQAGSSGQNGAATSGVGAAAGADTQGGAGAGGTSGGGGEGGSSFAAGNGGNGGSAPVSPTLTALEPSTLPFGSGAFELVLRGTNLRSDHQVSFDGNAFPTTFVSAEELRSEIPGIALGGRARSVNVFASRLASPPLRTNVLMFAITEP